jgi:hypothetical protein
MDERDIKEEMKWLVEQAGGLFAGVTVRNLDETSFIVDFPSGQFIPDEVCC